MRKLKTVGLIVITTFLSTLFFPRIAFAEEIQLLPKDIQDIIGQDPIIYVSSRIKLLLTLALGSLVLISLIFSIIAAIKYITAQGNEQKVEDAKKSFSGIMIGVGAFMLSMIGIVLVFRFFGVDPNTTICKTCIEYPDDPACIEYYDNDAVCPEESDLTTD